MFKTVVRGVMDADLMMGMYWWKVRDNCHRFIMDGFMVENQVGHIYGLTDRHLKLREMWQKAADNTMYHISRRMNRVMIPEVSEMMEDIRAEQDDEEFEDHDMGIGVLDFF